MSASNNKKLRSEQAAAKLTEKQLKEQKAERETRAYTIAFVVVLVILVVAAIFAGVQQKVTSSGMRERNTVAMTIGEHQISNAELSYYYIDGVNNFYSQNGSYAAMFGLDVTKPLDQQPLGSDGTTWADNFVDSAKSSVRSTYALVDAANAAGFTLTQEQENQVKAIVDNLGLYAKMYGMNNATAYLKAMYGNGATAEGFQQYYRMNLLADAYQSHYEESLTYSDADIRAYEADKSEQYNAYSYNQYFLSASNYLTGGTQDDSGNTTYTQEERSAAAAEAEKVAKTLVDGTVTSVEAFDKAIAAAVDGASSTAYTNQLQTALNSKVADWVSDPARKAGDKTYIPSTYTDTNEDGTEYTVTSGYYVVYFSDSTDNNFPLVNVRHILVSYEGGTQDETTGVTTYSDEEKAAARTEAEALLNEWRSGAATEESFAALATEKTDDPGSKDSGGLYEKVYPGQMVTAFNDWCFDDARKAGDTDIVETEYGCHVMYFAGEADISYRDHLISTDMRNADYESWYTALVDAAQVTDGDTSYLRTNLVLGGNS